MARSQISRMSRSASGRERLSSLLSQESFGSRRALGRRVCEEFSFVDALGRLQVSGCLKALAGLAEDDPGIILPAPLMPAVVNTPRQLESGVAEPVGVPDHPSRIRELDLVVVATPHERGVWNTLMAREHPHGMTIFAGCQVRYLGGYRERKGDAGPGNEIMWRRARRGCRAPRWASESATAPRTGRCCAIGNNPSLCRLIVAR